MIRQCLCGIDTHMKHNMKWALLVCIAWLFSGCSGCDDNAQLEPDMSQDMTVADTDSDADMGTDDGVEGANWYEVWRDMRETLRADPAYLRYERDRLVEAGDPAAMRLFVRDQIRTVPAWKDGWGAPNLVLYGTRGTLRYGAGSLRDKADLLVEMLTEAGFEAEIRQMSGPPADFTERVLKPREARVASIPSEKIDEWARQVGLEIPNRGTLTDANGDLASTLAQDLIDTLPSDVMVSGFDPTPPSQVPIVRYRENADGEWTFANLYLPDVPLGEIPIGNVPASAFQGTEAAPVTVELRLHTPTTPVDGELLVTGEFPTQELAGRQLRVGALPTGELADNLLLPITSFSTFLPMVALQGIDTTEETRTTYSFVGDAYTLQADRLAANEADGTLTINGTPIESDTDFDVSTIDGVTVQADARNFPEVFLQVDATANGTTVSGLPATAFQVTDRDESVAPFIERNVQRPRVVFVIDESTSLPAEFLTTQLAPLVVDIADTILTTNPLAEFRVQKVGASQLQGDWTQDTAFVGQEIERSDYGASNIWAALSVTAAADATACVMISDGEATDELTPSLENLLLESSPCVFLRAGGDPTFTDLEDMAALVGGEVFDIANQAEARMRILDFLQQDADPYRLRYISVNQEPGEHVVDVQIGAAAGSATYVAPDTADGQTFIQGIELVISTGPQRPEVRRMLFGSRDGDPLPFAEAQRALVGGHLIAFEGEAPIVHEMMDEVLENRLQLEPLTDAINTADEDQVLSTIATGARWMPAELLTVFSPRLEGDSVLYVDHLRAVMKTDQLVSPRERVQKLDVLSGPGIGLRSTQADPAETLRQGIEASVRTSILESDLYETSTIALLEGEDLVYLPRSSQLESVVPGLMREEVLAWQAVLETYEQQHFLVIPADGDPVAFYAIHKESGATYGVLADGSGGGLTKEQLEAQLDAINALLDWLSFGGSAMGASVPFGFWVALQKAIAKQIITATIAIVEMDGPSNITTLQDALNLACDLLRAYFLDIVDAGWIGIVEAFFAAFTGMPVIECFD